MNLWQQFLWSIFPYLMLVTCIVGHIYRYKTGQLIWKAKSSEFLEKKQLRWGSLLFHYGIFMVLIGHIAGLLIPKSWMNSLGINNQIYHAGAVFGGGIAGLVTFAGIGLLLMRRTTNRRVRVTSDFTDILIVVLLFFEVTIGLLNTLGYNLVVGEYDYRASIAPWIRGVFSLTPNPAYMAHVPILYQIHILFAFVIFGLWPFTRLVHVWSVPLSYISRSHIVYRRRRTVSLKDRDIF